VLLSLTLAELNVFSVLTREKLWIIFFKNLLEKLFFFDEMHVCNLPKSIA
jgi:hypothetical protein